MRLVTLIKEKLTIEKTRYSYERLKIVINLNNKQNELVTQIMLRKL